jgi:hypothetical protein
MLENLFDPNLGAIYYPYGPSAGRIKYFSGPELVHRPYFAHHWARHCVFRRIFRCFQIILF